MSDVFVYDVFKAFQLSWWLSGSKESSKMRCAPGVADGAPRVAASNEDEDDSYIEESMAAEEAVATRQ